MFPKVGSQIITEPGSPEDFHVQVKNVSPDEMTLTDFPTKASAKRHQRRRLRCSRRFFFGLALGRNGAELPISKPSLIMPLGSCGGRASVTVMYRPPRL